VKCSELHKGRDFEEVRVYEVCVWYKYSENVTMSRCHLFFAYFASSEFIDGLFVLHPESSILCRTLHFVKWICLSPHWPRLTVCNRSNE
jgi:hypothetical protein